MKKENQTNIKIQELDLKLIPESANDDHYDGVIHIARRARPRKFSKQKVTKRRALQHFTFD